MSRPSHSHQTQHNTTQKTQTTSTMLFNLFRSIRVSLKNRATRAEQKRNHRLITKVMAHAPTDELKHTYHEDDHGYDPKFEEAVLRCLRLQEEEHVYA